MRRTRGPATRRWLAALGIAALGAWSAHAGWFDGARQAAPGAGLSLATWNLEWLMTPATQTELSARCQRQQPRSHERALPCTPGRTPPPDRTQADLDALARTAQALHTSQRVDVVALVSPQSLLLAVVLAVLGTLGKYLAGYGGGGGMRAAVIGWGMVPRGEVGLVFVAVGSQMVLNGSPLLAPEWKAALVGAILLTTLLGPVGLNAVLARASRRPEGPA